MEILGWFVGLAVIAAAAFTLLGRRRERRLGPSADDSQTLASLRSTNEAIHIQHKHDSGGH